MVNRFDVDCEGESDIDYWAGGDYVTYNDYAELHAVCEDLATELQYFANFACDCGECNNCRSVKVIAKYKELVK